MTGKSESTYLYIRDQIITGKLKPMENLSESRFMTALKVSRTPVREAFLRLAEEHFVIIYPRQGTYVTAITMDLNRWVSETRYLCEPWICENAVGRIPRKELFRMREEFSALLKSPDKERSVELDEALHWKLAESTENPFIGEMMSRVCLHSRRIRLLISNVRTDYTRQDREHLQIVESLLTGDAELCRETMKEHIMASMMNYYTYAS